MGLPMTGIIYFAVGIICTMMFGDNLESSVLLNIGEARHLGKGGDERGFWEAEIC